MQAIKQQYILCVKVGKFIMDMDSGIKIGKCITDFSGKYIMAQSFLEMCLDGFVPVDRKLVKSGLGRQSQLFTHQSSSNRHEAVELLQKRLKHYYVKKIKKYFKMPLKITDKGCSLRKHFCFY